MMERTAMGTLHLFTEPGCDCVIQNCQHPDSCETRVVPCNLHQNAGRLLEACQIALRDYEGEPWGHDDVAVKLRRAIAGAEGRAS